MANEFLHRGDAPFGQKVWGAIDETVIGAAKGQMSARRLLHVEGPYGLGLKTLPGGDAEVSSEEDGIGLAAGSIVPVALIRKGFALPARDIASFEQTGLPMDLALAADAALACAQQEDDLVFNGSKALGVSGLTNAKGAHSLGLGSWASEPGTAADDAIKAVTLLDGAGFHGPYAMALAPALYNLLFRRYAQGNQTEMEHVRTIVTDGVVKAPALAKGGIVIASGRQYASIVLGQDLMTGFIGPAGGDYEFTVSESVALRLRAAGAVCVLKQ